MGDWPLYRTSYQKYSTDIKEAIRFSKNPNLFSDLHIPKSTAKEWIKQGNSTPVSMSILTIVNQEQLKQKLQRQEKRIIELESSLKLLKKSLEIQETSLKYNRIKDIDQKKQILSLVSSYQKLLPQNIILSVLSMSKSKLKRWKEDVENPSSKIQNTYVQQHPLGITEKEFL